MLKTGQLTPFQLKRDLATFVSFVPTITKVVPFWDGCLYILVNPNPCYSHHLQKKISIGTSTSDWNILKAKKQAFICSLFKRRPKYMNSG